MASPADAALVALHQAKVDARLADIDASLARLAESRVLAEQEQRHLEARVAAMEVERHPFLIPQPGWSLETAKLAVISARDRCVAVQRASHLEHASLLRRRTVLEKRITLAAFDASPIRRVPADVLLQIFLAVQSAAVRDLPSNSERGRNGPFRPHLVGQGPVPLLARVCSQWRASLCDTPTFWSSFDFRLAHPTPLLALYLNRARSAPLTLHILLVAEYVEEEWPVIESTIALLARHSQCIVELHFSYEDHFFLPPLLPLRGNLPALELLSLPAALFSSRAFEIAPRLRTLNLVGYDAPQNDPYWHYFPHDQINSLSVHNTDRDIERYPALTRLTSFQQPVWPPPDVPFDELISLPHLTSWRIEFLRAPLTFLGRSSETDGAPSYLFHLLDTPALRSLEIYCLEQPAQLDGFLDRSTFHLTSLALRDCRIQASELITILSHTPRLETLSILHGPFTMITNRILQYLSLNEDTAMNNLTSLSSLTITGVFAFGTVALIEMVESRTRGRGIGVRLRDVFKLRLSDRDIDEKDVEQLRRLDGTSV
ncbi:hypothetical protein C8R46DRAFT_438940 [Mycena filopes]|nr:hypothetical protein C8R46DRAFT_438940 [Mycena filopes]